MGVNDLLGIGLLVLLALFFANLGARHGAPPALPVDQASLRTLVAQLGTLQAENERLKTENHRLSSEVAALTGRSKFSTMSAALERTLREAIVERLTAEELRTLASDLAVDLDSLGGETLAGRAQQLIDYLRRRQRLGELVTALRRLRPDVELTL